MKIVHAKPPEWIMVGCLSQFRVNVNRTFWTYRDTIFNPGGLDIRPDIMAHEERHMQQQGVFKTHAVGDDGSLGEILSEGPDGWWNEYLKNPRFRLEQEADAYGVQYRFFCKRVKDRNKQARFLHSIAAQLSGPLYQLAVTPLQAKTMIEVLAGKKQLKP